MAAADRSFGDGALRQHRQIHHRELYQYGSSSCPEAAQVYNKTPFRCPRSPISTLTSPPRTTSTKPRRVHGTGVAPPFTKFTWVRNSPGSHRTLLAIAIGRLCLGSGVHEEEDSFKVPDWGIESKNLQRQTRMGGQLTPIRRPKSRAAMGKKAVVVRLQTTMWS
jgi:hypothetical protein